MSKIFHHVLPHLKMLGYMLSYSLLITISPHILAETPDEIIDDLNKEKISLIKQESSLKNQILDLDKTFNNSINEIDNEIQRTKKGFRDEKIDSSIRDLKSSSQKFTNLVKKKKIKIKDLTLQKSVLTLAISAETKMRTIHERNIIGGMSSSEELTSYPMVSMLRFIESQTKSDRMKLYEWCKTTMHCYPTRWDKSCLFEDYYTSKQYKRYMLEKADYKCTTDVDQQMWREDDIQRLPPVIDQLKKEAASVYLEIEDINNSKRSLNEDIKKLNIEKNEKISKLINPLINRQDKLKQEYKQRKSEIENALPSLRSQISQINARILEQKNISAQEKATQEKAAQDKLATERMWQEIFKIIIPVVLIFALLFFLHRRETRLDSDIMHNILRADKPGLSIVRLFMSKEKRREKHEKFSIKYLGKLRNTLAEMFIVASSATQKAHDKEMQKIKAIKDLIEEEENAIMVLNLRIEKERSIFKDLKTRHKYLEGMVDNR